MDILGQSALLVAITAFALAFSILARGVRNKLYLSFAGVGAFISAWALFFFLDRIYPAGGWYPWHLLMNLWLTPAALAFIRSLVRLQDRLSLRIQALSVLLASGLTVALFAGFDQVAWVRQLIYFLPGLVVVQTLALMWTDRRLRLDPGSLPPKAPAVGLGRRYLIYLGALLVLATSVMDHVPWTGDVVPVLGNLSLTAYLFFLSQAITQQRLLNFGALFSRFMVLLLVALTLTGIYSLLFTYIADNPALFLLNSFIVSFLIVMLLEPIRTLVAWLTDRMLTQKHQRLHQVVRDAQARLSGILDTQALFRECEGLLQQVLQPGYTALYLMKGDGTRYQRQHFAGEEPQLGPPTREILAEHPLLEHSRRMARRGSLPVLLTQILEGEIDRSTSRVQREALRGLVQALQSLGGNLLFPLEDSEQVLGFLVVAAPEPPQAWAGNWGLLQDMVPYFAQAARTLRNMEVYVRSREKDRLAALGEMAAGLAHEIRNPLGAIKGAAQFLDPSTERPESRFLQVIIDEVDRLNRVVTQFLDFSRPQVPDLVPVELNALAARAVEFLKAGARPGEELTFVPAPTEAWVLGSADLLRQVLLNLVRNAWKATEGGSAPRVEVRVATSEQGRRREYRLEVEDNGRGIRRENLEKLFIPFFTTDPAGTGLGLPISLKMVEAQQGRIEVQSEEGRFARFSVVLPSVPAEATSGATAGRS